MASSSFPSKTGISPRHPRTPPRASATSSPPAPPGDGPVGTVTWRCFSGGAWLRLSPQPGWRVWIEDEAVLLVFDGTAWIGVTPDALQGLTRLGLGTTADAANKFFGQGERGTLDRTHRARGRQWRSAPHAQ
ncbi:DUF2793 domain-containing protein [Jhaorihella thermophila]